MGLALGLALLACFLGKAESPVLRLYCADGEYPYAGQLCCKFCPAGTHVGEHCTIPHHFGRCIPCTEGVDYTEYPNGLNRCLSCDRCKPGYMMVRPCTAKSNTECRCPEGYYCPLGCEECIKCKETCPEGLVERQRCGPTTDMECVPALPGNSTLQNVGTIIGVLIITGICLLLLLGIWIYKKRKSRSKREKEKEGKDFLIPGGHDILNTKPEGLAVVLRNEVPENDERRLLGMGSTNEESLSGNVPSVPSPIPSVQSNVPEPKKFVVRVINSSSKELNHMYFELRSKVPYHDWNNLMRKSGLSDNDIEKIKYDNQNSIDEAHYQMLNTLKNRLGTEGALCKLLDGLWDLRLKNIYENVTNELINDNIIILETKD